MDFINITFSFSHHFLSLAIVLFIIAVGLIGIFLVIKKKYKEKYEHSKWYDKIKFWLLLPAVILGIPSIITIILAQFH